MFFIYRSPFIKLDLLDVEGNAITATLTGNPSFVTVTTGLEIAIKPTDSSHFGDFFFTVSCHDTYGLQCPSL